MACYCQYCKFIYPSGTPRCYSCGRSTTRDNLSDQHYLNNGYYPIENHDDDGSTFPRRTDPPAFDEVNDTIPNSFFTGSFPSAGREDAAAPESVLHGENAPDVSAQIGNDGNSFPGSSSSADSSGAAAVSVLQGENVPFVSPGIENNGNSSDGFAETDNDVNQELENLRRLEAEQERQRRVINRRMRRQRFYAQLLTLPWRYLFRGLLIILIIVLLIAVWNMRYSIFNGITSIIIALLPLILIIYCLVSLIRGHF